MNWNKKFATMHKTIQEEKKRLERLEQSLCLQEDEYKECIAFTDKFLKCCSKHNIKSVCINTSNEIVKESTTFPFGVHNSVFAEGASRDGFSAIWSVCEELGIRGCGNKNQHQLDSFGIAKLIDGAYQFKDGKWNKID